MLRPLLVLVCLALVGCNNEPPFDFRAACSTATSQASTPADLRRISDTVNGASNGDYKPKGKDAERWTAAVLLGEAARKAAAPYALPSEFQGSLPEQPDVSEVRRLQQRLATACQD